MLEPFTRAPQIFPTVFPVGPTFALINAHVFSPKAMVLHLFGVKWPRGITYRHSAYQIFTLLSITAAKLQLWSPNENNFIVGRVTTTWGTILKGLRFRKVENHWPKGFQMWKRASPPSVSWEHHGQHHPKVPFLPLLSVPIETATKQRQATKWLPILYFGLIMF